MGDTTKQQLKRIKDCVTNVLQNELDMLQPNFVNYLCDTVNTAIDNQCEVSNNATTAATTND